MRGCRFYFILLLKSCKCSLVPASFFPIYELCYIGAETWEEGGIRCQRALAAEGDRGAEEIWQHGEAEIARSCRGSGAGAKEEQVGQKARWHAPGSRRDGCRPRGSGGVSAVRQWAGACCHPPCLGRIRELRTHCRLPSTGGAIVIRQQAEEHRPSTKDVQYHRMAPRVRAS